MTGRPSQPLCTSGSVELACKSAVHTPIIPWDGYEHDDRPQVEVAKALDHLCMQNGTYSDTLFVHCGGKHRIPSVRSAMHTLGVNTCAIVDADAIRTHDTLAKILEAGGADASSVQALCHSFCKSLATPKGEIARAWLQEQCKRILESSTASYVSDDDLDDLRALLKKKSPWDSIKKSGFSGVPSGEQTLRYTDIVEKCAKAHVFIVPVGELEGFVRTVGGHGPGWVNSVIETHPDLNDTVYDELRKFVLGLGIL